MSFSRTGFGLFLMTSLLVLAMGVIAACGGDDEDTGNGTPAAHRDNGDEQENGEQVAFDVSMGDNFFEAKEFTVGPGDEITFNLANDGMAIHNMHIAGADNEYGVNICQADGEEPCSDPATINPGDSGALVWIAPEEPGTYDFRCDLHPVEMTGTITVQ